MKILVVAASRRRFQPVYLCFQSKEKTRARSGAMEPVDGERFKIRAWSVDLAQFACGCDGTGNLSSSDYFS